MKLQKINDKMFSKQIDKSCLKIINGGSADYTRTGCTLNPKGSDATYSCSDEDKDNTPCSISMY